MSGGISASSIVRDFDLKLKHIQETLRKYAVRTEENSDALNEILNMTGVYTEEDADKIDQARYWMQDPEIKTANDVVNSDKYTAQDPEKSKYHLGGDDDPSPNVKYLSDDGPYEYIVEPDIDPETGEQKVDPVSGEKQYKFVEDAKLAGTPNYGYEDPVSAEHVALDVNPWIRWGVRPTDETNEDQTPEDRCGIVEKAMQGYSGLVYFLPNAYDVATDGIGATIFIIWYHFETAEQTRSPLVLDLDGDGIETLALTAEVNFDHDGNRFAERSGWVAPDDGLLVYDSNGDGIIDRGSELFGNRHDHGTGEEFDNGFLALAAFDSNGDKQIDAGDAAFADLRIWRDLNGNGESEQAELFTLANIGVQTLMLDYTEASGDGLDAQGNAHLQLGSYLTADGQTRDMADVWFATDTAHTVQMDVPDISEEILALPDVSGAGNVGSLRSAMALDDSGLLQQAVEAFAAETDGAARRDLLLEIMYRWAGVHDIAPDARAATQVYGNAIGDARKLAVLEKFLGSSYIGIWCWGELDPNPHGPAAAILLDAFEVFSAFVDGQLMLQTHFLPLVEMMERKWSPDTGRLYLDVTELVAHFRGSHADDPDAATEVIYAYAEALKSLGGYAEKIFELIRAEGDETGGAVEQMLASFGAADTAGTVEADRINGTDAGDYIPGFAGADRLSGEDGNDTLIGGTGDDYTTGGNGSDIYRYNLGDGNDTINNHDSDGGTDTLVLGPGIKPGNVDVVRSHFDLVLEMPDGGAITVASYLDQAGTTTYALDTIRFNNGTEWTPAHIMARLNRATEQDDFIQGDDSDEAYSAKGGNDDLNGAAGNDTLSGGAGNDRTYGQDGDDSLIGGQDDDRLYGEAGDDTLEGGVGDDYLEGGLGSDTYRFGRDFGNDLIQNYASAYYDDADKADRIFFTGGITPDEVAAKRVGNDLYLTVGTSQLRVSSHFYSTAYAIAEVVFGNGSVWDATEILHRTQIGTTEADLLIGDGSDDVLSGLAGRDTVRGEGGNDSLNGGADRDTVQGGDGDDTLIGGAGDDYLEGNVGSDTYVFGPGFGVDRINNYASSYYDDPDKLDRILFNGSIGPGAVTARRSYDDLILSVGDNEVQVLRHFRGENYAIGEIEFSNGDIWDAAEILSQTQNGTADGDLLVGSGIDDTLSGRAGRDTIQGEDGDDLLRGGADNDLIYAGVGDDTLEGGDGDDYLEGGYGSDVYRFGPGFGSARINNYAYANYDTENKVDVIEFTGGIGPGAVAVRRTGNDLYLSVGDNVIRVQSHFRGPDYAIGRVDFANGSSWDAAEILRRSQVGTDLGDLLVGSDIDDTLSGLAGNDTIEGEAGNDSLRGGTDNDRIDGGSGDDTLDGGSGNDTLEGGAGSDVYRFGADFGNDRIYNYVSAYYDVEGKSDRVLFTGGTVPGDVTVRRTGNDLVMSVGANELVVQNHFYGSSYAIQQVAFSGGALWDSAEVLRRTQVGTDESDLLVGSDIDDTLSGLAGVDTIRGEGGNDSLRGGADNDAVYGGDGNDTLEGGEGDDYLQGDAGSDVYRFAPGFGTDRIYNYASPYYETEAKTDRILFTGGITPDDVSARRVYNDLYLYVGTDTLRVQSQFSGDQYGVQRIEFAGGALWDNNEILRQTQGGTVEADLLVGTEFDDTLSGLAGRDTLRGEEGNDELRGDGDNDYVAGGDGDDSLRGDAGNDDLEGGAGNDTLVGGTGNDTLEGGYGSDVYRFGPDFGSDYVNNYAYSYYEAADKLDRIEFAGAIGPAAVRVQRSSNDMYLHVGDNVVRVASHFSRTDYAIDEIAFANGIVWDAAEILRQAQLGTETADYLVGSEIDDTLSGKGGSDTIDGQDGNDLLHGGDDNDRIYGQGGNDTLKGGAGDDHLDGDYYIDSGDDLLEGGEGNDTLNGGYGSDTLIGGEGDDRLDGGADNDRMEGGAGSDTYTVDHVGDRVFESKQWAGTDQVNSSITYYLGKQHIENLTLSGSGAVNGFGNGLDNEIIGNYGANRLFGSSGNDFLKGGSGNDTVEGWYGNDTLHGDGGNDLMLGGPGSDTYYVTDVGDTVNESRWGGRDHIIASHDFRLGTAGHIEDLTLNGYYAIEGAGNGLDNLIIGNSRNNLLTGNKGQDTLFGGDGDDTLNGEAGGGDRAEGGRGSDTYIVNHTKDIVVELATDYGTDLVKTSAVFHLTGTHVENLEMLSNRNISGFGNELDNIITGNSGSNQLDGGAGGRDTLIGGGSNDIYHVRSTDDVVIEEAVVGSGVADSIWAYVDISALADNVENVVARGGDALSLTGNAVANQLIGNNAANVLNGKEGSDRLCGNGGPDQFVFDTEYGGANIDHIVDFTHNGDKIVLGSGVFANVALGALAAGAFVNGTAAADEDDRVIYDQATGRLWYDVNGDTFGGQRLFAVLDNSAVLDAGDFLVI